jgi:hypothetical protein
VVSSALFWARSAPHTLGTGVVTPRPKIAITRVAEGRLLSATALGALDRVPHGLGLCVHRLGTLRGHRSLSCDLTCPTTTPSTPPRFGSPSEIVIRLRATDSRETRKSPILNTRMVGGPGFEPGASRSRIRRCYVQPRRFLPFLRRNVRSGVRARPETGQSSAELLHEVLQATAGEWAAALADRRSPNDASGRIYGRRPRVFTLPTVLKTAAIGFKTRRAGGICWTHAQALTLVHDRSNGSLDPQDGVASG